MDPEKQLMDETEPQESDMDDDEKRIKGDWHQQLYKACQKGDLATVERCLSKKANVFTEDKKKWNSLMWASCRGYLEIVRLLISKGAATMYCQDSTTSCLNFAQTAPIYSSPLGKGMSQSPYGNQSSLQGSPNNQQFNFNQTNAPILTKKVVQGIINQQVRSTPLQWACFKGHLQIVWLLLRNGLSWEDVDQFGNNSVHLAASGGSVQVFQTLIYFGVSVDRPNTRGHTAKDLATNITIIGLIKSLENSNSNDKHYCMSCRNFIKFDDYRLEWVFENADSNECEKPEGRCNNCWERIKIFTDDLMEIIDKQDHKLLSDKLIEIEQNRIEIDPKSMKRALIEQEKLRTQNVILEYIKTQQFVPNYKTIMKSVNQIKRMLDDAVERNVIIDDHVKDIAQKEMDRLVAERNLQFQLDNLDVGQSTQEQVVELSDKVVAAEQKGVAMDYITQASELRDKMAKAIQAKKILRMFNEYPQREIPDAIKWDFKTKKPIDPITNKPMDALKLALQQQKKKKKKEPKFVIPEWANDIKSLDENIKGLEGLLKEAEVLNLNGQFIEESIGQIKRMKNEMRFRKETDDQLKLIADDKIAQKKKNK